MRRAIDRDSARLKGVLADEAMRKHFLGGTKTDAKALKAFVEGNKSNALKTKPKVCSPLRCVVIRARASSYQSFNKHLELSRHSSIASRIEARSNAPCLTRSVIQHLQPMRCITSVLRR